jgi:hypothetical protein
MHLEIIYIIPSSKKQGREEGNFKSFFPVLSHIISAFHGSLDAKLRK